MIQWRSAPAPTAPFTFINNFQAPITPPPCPAGGPGKWYGPVHAFRPVPWQRRRGLPKFLEVGVAVFLMLSLSAQANAAENDKQETREVVVTASRLGIGLPGTSTTVITQEDIERSPARTIPELLSLEAGVTFKDSFGNTGGAGQSVDVRGFGEFSAQNTLILLNGRRLNDLDLANINFAAIPKNAIERIEIIRGNAGAVLYGDGAQGGVINIVTKTDADEGPHGAIEQFFGSDSFYETRGEASYAMDGYAVRANVNYINADGYRDNNRIIQKNFTGELRRKADTWEAFVNLDYTREKLGLPGTRLVDPSMGINQLKDPRGASAPNNFAKEDGFGVTLGGRHQLTNTVELVLDGGIRQKNQLSRFVNFFERIDTRLTTYSLTPRAIVDWRPFDRDTSSILGIDYYFVDYTSNRMFTNFDADQSTVAAYLQNTVQIEPDLSAAVGARVQRTRFSGRELPGFFSKAPLTKVDVEYALNGSLEYDINQKVSVFTRAARSFRQPNIDERIGTSFFDFTFRLEPQTSHDVEVGTRFEIHKVKNTASVYYMKTRNEIFFDPDDSLTFGANRNADPIRRVGIELTSTAQLSDDLRLKGTLTYVNARFTEGPFSGNQVPLVPPLVTSAEVRYAINKYLSVDTTLTYESDRKLGNDQAGLFPKLPSFLLWDAKLSGEYKHIEASVAVHNILDRRHETVGFASDTTPGRFNVDTLPGRTFLLKAGGSF